MKEGRRERKEKIETKNLYLSKKKNKQRWKGGNVGPFCQEHVMSTPLHSFSLKESKPMTL